jgi:hypothetical protein
VINRVKKTKFLGVIINDTLSWEDHVKLVKRKVNKNISVICRLCKCMPRSVLLQLYYNLINPYFEYCNIVWATDRSTLLNELFRCQKKPLRTIRTTETFSMVTSFCLVLPAGWQKAS